MAGGASGGGFSSDDADGALSDINVTPLVDVTLVLLIVFMITVPAIVGSARVKIDVPQTSSVPAESDQIALNFSLKTGEGGQTVLYLNENQIDEAGLRKMFGTTKPTDDQQVSLAADQGIDYGRVMKVIDLLKSLGFKKLSLDTKHVE